MRITCLRVRDLALVVGTVVMAFGLFATQSRASVVFVSDVSSNRVGEYDVSTGVLLGNLTGGHLNAPYGLSVGPDGNLYVANLADHDVLRYSTATRAYIDTFASDPVRLGTVWFVTFGPNGNMYTSSQGGGLCEWNGTTGAFITQLSANPTYQELAFASDGNLYAANGGSFTVDRYNGTTGASMGTFATVPNPEGANNMLGAAFGPDGNLYTLSENQNNTNGSPIDQFNGSTGAFIGTFNPGSGSTFPSGAAAVLGLEFAPDGSLWVADSSYGVKRFNGTTGQFIDTFITGFNNAGGIAFVVPEPASLSLLSLAGIALLARRQRHRAGGSQA